MAFLNFISSMFWAFVWLFLLTIVSVVAVGFMPKSHPLYELLTALNKKLLVTLGLAVITGPVELIPFVDVAYDLAAPIYLLFSWAGFVKDAISMDSPLRKRKPPALEERDRAASRRAEPEVVDALPSPKRRAAPAQQDAQDSYF